MKKNMGMSIRLFLAVAAIMLCPAVSCSDLSSECKADVQAGSGLKYIGSPFPVTLTIQYPEGAVVEFPELKESLGSFLIQKTGEQTKEKKQGTVFETQTVSLVTFDVGEQTIPSLVFKASFKGEQLSVTTQETPVIIESLVPVEADKKLLKGIRGPYDIPFSWKPYRPWLFVFLVVILLLLTAWLIFRKIKAKQRKKEEKIIELPWVKALRLIGALKEKTYETPSSIKELYYEVSLITRHYIEERFSLAAPERTTEEFLFLLAEDSSIERKYKDVLKRFLTECDKVKYARYQPTRNERHGILGTAEEFVRKTVPYTSGDIDAGI